MNLSLNLNLYSVPFIDRSSLPFQPFCVVGNDTGDDNHHLLFDVHQHGWARQEELVIDCRSIVYVFIVGLAECHTVSDVKGHGLQKECIAAGRAVVPAESIFLWWAALLLKKHKVERKFVIS